MVDKIKKALQKLSSKESIAIKKILESINKKDFEGLDLKKLKSREDIYRIRKGNIRIIFMIKGNSINILTIERRNSKTYSSNSLSR
jgi:mRNA-degrading endonuclease RelE of RelBE toxin-antitoxin system